jgi:hypothetical protein
MITKKGWASQLMMSLYGKEATYNAGVTMSGTTACSMQGFESEVTWPDTVVNDKAEVTGKEHGYDQEITQQAVELTYKEPKAKPNTIAGLAALGLGSVTSTQDGALAAYRHKIVPVAAGSALPSVQVESKIGGIQYGYKGIKCKTLKLSGEAGNMVSLEAGLMGSGTRTTSATAFPSAISESWLKLRDCKVWMENGSTISIAASLTQDAQNISSGAPASLGARLKSFEWSWDNALEGQVGFGGAGVFQDADYGQRKAALKFTMLFNDSTELDHFLNQRPLAIEFDLKGTGPIATGGAYYYGMQLIVPRFKLKAAPLPKGAAGEVLTCELDCEVFEDGTNPASIIEVYTAKPAYLA